MIETAAPEVGAGSLLIQVKAAGANFFDILLVQGKYQVLTLSYHLPLLQYCFINTPSRANQPFHSSRGQSSQVFSPSFPVASFSLLSIPFNVLNSLQERLRRWEREWKASRKETKCLDQLPMAPMRRSLSLMLPQSITYPRYFPGPFYLSVVQSNSHPPLVYFINLFIYLIGNELY